MVDPIGKRELLRWVSEKLQHKVKSFTELRNGAIFYLLFRTVFPDTPREARISVSLRSQNSEAHDNHWNAVEAYMRHVRIPLELLDRNEIEASRFHATYSFLVMLFFLWNLARDHDFSVDFSHPVDPALAEFLQSPASIESLIRGGALQLDEDDYVEDYDVSSPPAYSGTVQLEPTSPFRSSKSSKYPHVAVLPSPPHVASRDMPDIRSADYSLIENLEKTQRLTEVAAQPVMEPPVPRDVDYQPSQPLEFESEEFPEFVDARMTPEVPHPQPTLIRRAAQPPVAPQPEAGESDLEFEIIDTYNAVLAEMASASGLPPPSASSRRPAVPLGGLTMAPEPEPPAPELTRSTTFPVHTVLPAETMLVQEPVEEEVSAQEVVPIEVLDTSDDKSGEMSDRELSDSQIDLESTSKPFEQEIEPLSESDLDSDLDYTVQEPEPLSEVDDDQDSNPECTVDEEVERLEAESPAPSEQSPLSVVPSAPAPTNESVPLAMDINTEPGIASELESSATVIPHSVESAERELTPTAQFEAEVLAVSQQAQALLETHSLPDTPMNVFSAVTPPEIQSTPLDLADLEATPTFSQISAQLASTSRAIDMQQFNDSDPELLEYLEGERVLLEKRCAALEHALDGSKQLLKTQNDLHRSRISAFEMLYNTQQDLLRQEGALQHILDTEQSHDDSFAKLNSRAESLRTSLADLTQRLDVIENSVEAPAAAVDALQSEVTALKAQLECQVLAAQNPDISGKLEISRLNQENRKLEHRVTFLKEKVAKLSTMGADFEDPLLPSASELFGLLRDESMSHDPASLEKLLHDFWLLVCDREIQFRRAQCMEVETEQLKGEVLAAKTVSIRAQEQIEKYRHELQDALEARVSEIEKTHAAQLQESQLSSFMLSQQVKSLKEEADFRDADMIELQRRSNGMKRRLLTVKNDLTTEQLKTALYAEFVAARLQGSTELASLVAKVQSLGHPTDVQLEDAHEDLGQARKEWMDERQQLLLQIERMRLELEEEQRSKSRLQGRVNELLRVRRALTKQVQQDRESHARSTQKLESDVDRLQSEVEAREIELKHAKEAFKPIVVSESQPSVVPTTPHTPTTLSQFAPDTFELSEADKAAEPTEIETVVQAAEPEVPIAQSIASHEPSKAPQGTHPLGFSPISSSTGPTALGDRVSRLIGEVTSTEGSSVAASVIESQPLSRRSRSKRPLTAEEEEARLERRRKRRERRAQRSIEGSSAHPIAHSPSAKDKLAVTDVPDLFFVPPPVS